MERLSVFAAKRRVKGTATLTSFALEKICFIKTYSVFSRLLLFAFKETAMGDLRSKSIETRIHDHYDSLPESERKLADVILDSPGDLSVYTATELTALAGVSKAAGTRLFRRLGFASFDEAKALVKDTMRWGSPLYKEKKPHRHSAGIAEYVDEEIRSLKKTLLPLEAGQIDEMTQHIVAARRVFLIGFRNSAYLAGYLRWQLLQFRGDVYMLPGTGETLGEYVADFIKGDLLIVFAMRRRVVGLDQILTLAKEREASIMLLTDPTARGLPALADWTVTCEVESDFVFDSCSSAMALARYIAIQAFHKAGKRGQRHLKKIEQQHEALKAFK